ncbi:hypothetical protein OG851_40445 [Streptomyces sp. NBC_00161]|uniref:hypothetical protein n=1 Tax=Streptomyces sp. NBC_00161 TaxID=2975671 RepID=UPI003249BFF0
MNRLKALTADDWMVMVAVIAAVVAVWQAAIARRSAGRQLALAERIHREQNEPYVIVDIQPDPDGGALLLVVENTGPTVARNVRISCDPPLESGWAPRAINQGAALYARDGSAPDRLFWQMGGRAWRLGEPCPSCARRPVCAT